ncbi:VWA domain-containing protein [Tomitella gaofuii]|uniref:VWA domain-containing protein n=1 Tax=Tomitella gaofuii TaxID=2760083 RepID=UPI0015FD5F53|nr:VWA domain-containing protein [Tomitella gaofuii]
MHVYPFSALVGADDLQLALTLAAVSPAVGGVLVRGEKGTAKSTAVRAQAALLPPVLRVEGCRFACAPDAPDPHCPDGPHAPGAAATVGPARLVELPVGAAEDRVTGSLHLGKALSGEGAEYEPGLLARAHRGVLYVDEVNLLHDHLVDLLLDAAAMGRTSVERDGVSISHASRFVLVGTMNPEEGELRPQLLDRFGLAVDVAAPRDAAVRAEIVRRRLAFDADPAGFAARWADAESELARRIAGARERVGSVVLGDAALTAIAEVCAAFDVDGMRADLVTAKAAAAHAAWCGRTGVTREDIAAAARLTLPHRRRRAPFDDPGTDGERLDELLDGMGDAEGPNGPGDGAGDDGPGGGGPEGGGPEGGGPEGGGPEGGGPEDDGPGGGAPEPADDGSAEQRPRTDGGADDDANADRDPGTPAERAPAPAGAPFRARLLAAQRAGRGAAGRRSRARTTVGRTVGARRSASAADPAPVHLPATIRAAVVRRGDLAGPQPPSRAPFPATRRGNRRAADESVRGSADSAPGTRITPADLRRKIVEGRETNLVLLCVDASGSMAARTRMEQVKAAVLSLLLDAYRRRDTVGLVTFRGDSASVVLPPTNSVDIAAARLRDLPTGGRTPLAEGLDRAAETLRRHRLRAPDLRPLLIVVTDGRATAGPDAVGRSLAAADRLAAAQTPAVVLDCETGRFRMGLARDLAQRLGAEYSPVGDVRADAITAAAAPYLQHPRTGKAA